jgi:hypothetical protein
MERIITCKHSQVINKYNAYTESWWHEFNDEFELCIMYLQEAQSIWRYDQQTSVQEL